ncbi:HNH endonuclease signature motif containing protein [Angustibacter speluncae]
MTSAVVFAPVPQHPVLAGAEAVHALLDGLLAGPVDGVDHEAAITGWTRVARRVEALRLRLVSAADGAGVATDLGLTGTDAWLAARTRTDRASAVGTLRLAGALEEPSSVTSVAVCAGEVSTEHARVVVDTLAQLPASVTPEQRDVVERHLVEQAREVAPARLRRLARRALAAVEPDPVVVDAHEDALLRTEEDSAHDRARLTLHDNDDGTVSGHFTVPSLAGSILRKVVDAMTAPRRARPGVLTGAMRFDREHRARLAGQAFTELLEHLPTDRVHGKVAATVVVTLDHDTLVGAVRAAGLDTGDRLTAGEARRLACGAGLLPVVLGGASQVLDAGRTQRLFTQTQRTVLATRHHTCAADGCDRPYAWCELHRKPWSAGGGTDLADAVPLCGFHHRRVHDRGYEHRFRSDGSVTFHRRT